MSLTQEVKEMMDECISLQDEIDVIQSQLKPLQVRKRELSKRKKQILEDVCGELETVVGYKNYQFGNMEERKTKYTKQNIIEHLDPQTHDSFVNKYTEVEQKTIFSRIKRQRTQ